MSTHRDSSHRRSRHRYTNSRSLSPRRSPSRRHRTDDKDSRSRHRKRARSPSPTDPLPLNASRISTRDHDFLSPIFASYLQIQKNLSLTSLDTREAKGRFKSFVSHYNRGELARGWYERVTTAQRSGRAPLPPAPLQPQSPEAAASESDSDSDDDFLPPLPGQEKKHRRHGPSAPNTSELALQSEVAAEDAELARADLRYHRKADRRAQKEALEEIVPRAEPGTKERQLEKKKELAEKMRGFRERSPGGEIDDATLIGGGDGESFAQKKAALERKKNERELRREQLLKARIAEREERVQGMREKEERTMAMLKALAESRFGGGGAGRAAV
ncbi:hypothetical protein FN846DRAFT_927159 [Sphaerosporella brunnea]|uniref:Uncharacterized protein n=1 Tax=Sphaerosporella brunnea TaxID=1250544 RepID=A0A5J5FA33_9PEZI|nr:hypothetical protein FN846DRAFT_927159 [Sphaerosporella brunnea]